VHATLGHVDPVTHCSAHSPAPLGASQQTCPDGQLQLERQLTAGHVAPRRQYGAHAPLESATLQQISPPWHASAPHTDLPPG
jgi:hypothetical protein